MGNIAVSDKGDDRSLAIDYINRTNDWFSFIACGIGCRVSDLINTRRVVIYGTIGICRTVPIDNIVPLRTLINIGGRCEMGDILVSD